MSAGSWYYMMYTIHGMDFINNFLGVHNFLRATQSEHPRWDVWWYYTMIFFAGCLPWCWTLPAAIIKAVKRQRLPEIDMTTGFLLTWALVVNVFYQCMATKYTTYTLPALLPIAILMARYLYQREVLVKRTVIGAIVVYGILTFALAIPACSDEGYSGKNIAAAYKDVVKDDADIVGYGLESVGFVHPPPGKIMSDPAPPHTDYQCLPLARMIKPQPQILLRMHHCHIILLFPVYSYFFLTYS